MKKLTLLAMLTLALCAFAQSALAETVTFNEGNFGTTNIFTGSNGITLTLENNNAIEGWDANKGLELKIADSDAYLNLLFSSAVNIERLNYSHGSKKASMLVYVGLGEYVDTLLFDPSKGFLDLSSYSGITSLSIQLVAGSQANTGNFYLSDISFGPAPAPTPVPAAVWLMGSGLAGLVALRRKVR